MPPEYATTSNVFCDENMHYDVTCVIASKALSSMIALLLVVFPLFSVKTRYGAHAIFRRKAVAMWRLTTIFIPNYQKLS